MNDDFFSGLADELEAKLRRITAFTSHAPSVGAYHEEALRTVLRSLLPGRFALRTGFAYHTERGASQQGDILIVDESHPGAYFFREGDFAVVDSVALVAVIEVKTTLTKRTFLESMSLFQSFRDIGNMGALPYTFLFAYESRPLTEGLLDKWYRASNVPDEPPNYPWGIITLNGGAIIPRLTGTGPWGHAVCRKSTSLLTRVQSLSLFLQLVRKAMHKWGNVDSDPFSQARTGIAVLNLSTQVLRFGKSLHGTTNT